MIEIKLEKLSGHDNNGKVGKVNVKIGDTVKEGDILLQVESKKGNFPVKSNTNGKIVKILVEEDQTVTKGDILFKLEDEKNTNNTSKTSTSKPSGNFNYFSSIMKPKNEEIEADITIIGGGPGGYVAAIHAAKQKAKVVLIEKEKVGGTCLNWGCIPTKALVRSSEVYKHMKTADEFGLFAENVSVDMKKVVERKNNIKNQLINGIEYLLDKHKVKKIDGVGEIFDENTVFVKNKRTHTTIKTKNIIIATGSKTSTSPIKEIDPNYLLTSKEALDLKTLPKQIVIVGGGVIGIEFAFIFANFGVDVFVVEFADKILASLDDDVCNEITAIAQNSGIKIYTNSKVEAIDKNENGNCIVTFTKDNEKRYISSDKVLVAIGRQPYFEGLSIENLGIEMTENKQGIKVNERMQTNIPNIYAIGDVTNIIQLAHAASHQGIIAVDNILGKDKIMDYSSIPSAIFTNPEIATVGICEKAAKLKEIDVEVGKFPFSANGKALTLGESRGFVKIIKDKSTGKIIGSTIIGPHATDLLAVVTLGIKNNLTTKQITETIFAHPTTAEAIHEASLEVEGGAIHFVK
ncbi:dihydrolipoyl dehydrogenase [Clostridium ganghwense]|uniref:Dihydrolipoyl dehydrogenase n=1 Tax=Clostridium ganghwense TaxID=312089 RepID=A0ABT4CNZ6_9CLOT|nr:dihydrolipoyl dehydrogenase [Clostridium ganghwense]MCY6369796.1 dihydrolipoyl dehydrogenase [Clostridium ganghwense]